MKILVINPVGTDVWNENDKKIYESFASGDTKIDVVSLEDGPISIETRYSEAIAVPKIVELALKLHEEYDAIIVNCCADPAVDVLRTLLDKPVIGPCEASLALASLLGKKLAIVTVSKTGIPIFEELVLKYKFDKLVTSIRAIELSVPEIDKDLERTKALLIKECKKSEEEGAEVVLLGCTGFAGLAKEIEQEVGIPVIDPVGAAIKIAEALVSLGLMHSRKRYFG